MKINPFLSICAIAIGLVYILIVKPDMAGRVSVLTLIIPMFIALGVSVRERPNSSILLKTCASVFFVVILLTNIVLNICDVSLDTVIAVDVILTILEFIGVYVIVKSKQ